MSTQVGPFVAFLGGLVSFVSPCVLPLVPVYMGIITGYSFSELRSGNLSTKRLLLSLSFFIAGFTLSFVLLGATASAVGGFLDSHYLLFKRLVGVFLVFWALCLFGILKFDFLKRNFHIKDFPLSRSFAPFVLGVAFGFSWSPCVGAFLVPILSMAILKERMMDGVFLLFCYSMGIALPMVIVALFFSRAMSFFSFFQAHFRKIETITAGIIFIFGLYLIFGGML